MPLPTDPGLIALALGTGVGLVLALSGAGAGSLAVPLLIFALNLPIQQAAPIGLFAIALAAGLGAFLGWREGILRYRAAALMGGSGLLCAPIGVWLAHRLPEKPLLLVFAALLAWTALRMLGHARSAESAASGPGNAACRLDPVAGRFAWNRPCARLLALTGMTSGVLSGLLGVGGGFVIVPALTRHSDLPARSIVATSLGVMTLVSLGGITSAIFHDGVRWPLALPFALGTLAGLGVGQRWARHLPGQRLQQSFGALCLILALSLVHRALS